jgi:transposase IS66 family protein
MGWIAQLCLLSLAWPNVGLCFASSVMRPADVDRISIAREAEEDRGAFRSGTTGERLAAEAALERVRVRLSEFGQKDSVEMQISMPDHCRAIHFSISRNVPASRVEALSSLSAERPHGEDTTVPVLAKGKTSTGRISVYVRDDKPFGGQAPPGAVFYYSRDRAGEHPQAHMASYSGLFQADAYGGYGRLYDPGYNAGPILEASC